MRPGLIGRVCPLSRWQALPHPVAMAEPSAAASEALSTLVGDAAGPSAPGPALEKTLRTLHSVLRRCAEEPGEARWRRLKMANPRFEREVVARAGGVELLAAAGFVTADFGTALVLPPLAGRPEAVARLHAALEALERAASAVGEGLALPAVDLGPSRRAAVGLRALLASDDIRRAVLAPLCAVELWPLRLVGRGFVGWVGAQLAEQRALSVGALLSQTATPRRELAALVGQCTSLRSLSWDRGGGRATPRHADALGQTLAAGLRRSEAPLQALQIGGAAALSWGGLAAMLRAAAPLDSLRQLEFVAGEAASEPNDEPGRELVDEDGALVGHRSGAELAEAFLSSCHGLERLTFRGGGGDGGPSRVTLASLALHCRGLQALCFDSCMSVDAAALDALLDSRVARVVLTARPRMGVTLGVRGRLVEGGLESLSLEGAEKPEAGPAPLCASLAELDISGCAAIGDDGLRCLQRGGVSLRCLRANDCPRLTDDGVGCVITPALEVLELASRRSIGDQTLLALANVTPSLLELDLSSGFEAAAPLSDAAVVALAAGCPSVRCFRASCEFDRRSSPQRTRSRAVVTSQTRRCRTQSSARSGGAGPRA